MIDKVVKILHDYTEHTTYPAIEITKFEKSICYKGEFKADLVFIIVMIVREEDSKLLCF